MYLVHSDYLSWLIYRHCLAIYLSWLSSLYHQEGGIVGSIDTTLHLMFLLTVNVSYLVRRMQFSKYPPPVYFGVNRPGMFPCKNECEFLKIFKF